MKFNLSSTLNRFRHRKTTDDLLAIYVAVVLVAITLAVGFLTLGEFRAVKFGNWLTFDELFTQLVSFDFLLSYGFSWLVLSTIFAVTENLTAKRSFGDSLKAFTGIYFLASIVYVLSAQITMSHYLEYAFWALIVGLVVRNIFGVPDWLAPALKSGSYVKAGLVIMGTEVLFSNITQFGFYGIAIVLLVVPATMVFMWYFGTKFLKMEDGRSVMVIATATAVCGVSAAIASAAAVKAKKEDLSFAVSMVILFTIVMMTVMPFLAEWMGVGELIGGAWIGNTVDSTGAVVLAGEALGPLASQAAALIKMIQNLLIGVVVFVLAWFFAREELGDEAAAGTDKAAKVPIREIWQRMPKFVLGFLGMSLFFSFVLAPILGMETTNAFISQLGTWKSWFFCLTFLSIGLETDFRTMAEGMEGGKPVSLYIGGQTFSVVISLIVCILLLSGMIFPIPDMQIFGGM